MTNKTVTMSLELAQFALNAVEYLALRADDIGYSNEPVAAALRALLAAPVVERQVCYQHSGEPCQCITSPPAPVAVVLAETREWLGDGKNSDGLAREHWTPEYAALIDRIDATLRK